jgi:hypothetical protein
MSNFKQFLVTILLLNSFVSISAQVNTYEVVLSGGTGYSLSNLSLKSATNLGLKEAGLDSRVQTTLLVNGMLDVCVVKRLSVGLAYSHKVFYWSDVFQDTIQGVPALASVNVNIQKRNYALRCLYHFGNSENFEFYSGLRVGFTYWKFGIDAEGEVATYGTPSSKFSVPASYPSIQAIGGFRHYIGRVFGWFGEVGFGTSPYFCSVGLNVRINPNK